MLASLQQWFSADATLAMLFAGAFLAATLVPLSSEALLFAVLKVHPEMVLQALAVATLGNTAGGMVSYGMGRLAPHRSPLRHEALLRRHGAVALLGAWLPLVGDALCIGAGWLRLDWRACLFFMALGRAVRYAAVVWLA
jgi:membrane protein YqaA with SNARE-associated domain